MPQQAQRPPKTLHPKCNLTGTADLDDTGGTKVDPHTVGSGAETTVETATGADQNDLASLSC